MSVEWYHAPLLKILNDALFHIVSEENNTDSSSIVSWWEQIDRSVLS